MSTIPFQRACLSEPARYQRRGGMALIIVLSMVVLLTAMVVGLLQRAGSERIAAASYGATASTRQLADTAVNLVQGQINQATCKGSSYAWASQPGAIRVYKNDGSLDTLYRLYSAAALSTTTPASLSNDLPGSTDTAWQTKSSPVWVDLNAPAINSTDTLSYPIIDPRDPANPAKTLAMDGFAVNGAGCPAATATQTAAMPVKWLYILQDGQILAPTSGGPNATSITISGSPAATKDNPIVGRIAYWTDDETCKVNINTAGGDGIATGTPGAVDPTPIADATFWSPPYFCAPDEVILATKQPASGEFQRYPGHPATVSLNNILNGLGWRLSSSQFYNQVNSSGVVTAPGITPRYTFGGSQGGTLTVDASTQVPLAPSDRLYSSVSEMLFDTSRKASLLNDGTAKTRQRAETARFFLTAHSRAPEVNLFGQPRVSMWPVWDTSATKNLSAIDKLLSFCATIKNVKNPTDPGPGTYYFTRRDSTDSTVDIGLKRNQTLLKYLDTLTSTDVPGYGGKFSTKYQQPKAWQILTEIFDYIRTINIADSTQAGADQFNKMWIPGSWYSSGLYQVAPSLNTIWGSTTLQGFGIYPRLTDVAIQFVALGSNPTGTATTNIPLSANYTSSVVTNLGLAQMGDSGVITTTASPTLPVTYSAPPGTTAVQAFLVLQFVIPSQMRITSTNEAALGTGRVNPCCWIQVSSMDQFTLNNYSLKFPKQDKMVLCPNAGWWESDTWEAITLNGMFNQKYLVASPSTNFQNGNPFYSAIIPVTVSAASTGTMTFSGGQITIDLFDGSNMSALPSVMHKVQTYTIGFPKSAFSVPTTMTTSAKVTPSPTVSCIISGSSSITLHTGFSVGVSGSIPERWNIEQRGLNPAGIDTAIYSGDVIASMVLTPAWSDARMLAVSSVPSTAFVKHPLWDTSLTTTTMAHSLTIQEGVPLNWASGTGAMGTLVSGITPDKYGALNPTPWYKVYPMVPPTLTSGASVVGAGDWDNGLGGCSDGPWINKADEGVLNPTAGNYAYYSRSQGESSTKTAAGNSFFSPNREVPSPGMLGSLPTGVDPSGASPQPWQTLLFQPGRATHPGRGTPPDHLFLDLFWMPVGEPYAISEPFSTAGKVNLNYQIAPFSYITRSTALRAVLASEKVAAVSGSQAGTYKTNVNFQGVGMATNARVALNLEATLAQFDTKFKTNDIFHSASQICEIYLVPKGYNDAASFATDWYNTGVGGPFALVGDNVRERPYTNIYSRVTTKSNTYTVYFTVQVLNNKAASNPSQWDEGKGAIMGEYRGSTTLERFIDPGATIPDYAATAGAANLETYYKWRVVANHQFAP